MANDIYRINEFNDDERGGGNGDHRNGDISNGQLNGTTISNDHHHHKNNSEKNRHQSMKSLMMNGNTNTVAINHSGSYNNNHHHHNNHCDHHQHHLFDNIHHKIINISQQSLNDKKINEQTVVDHCAHINVINHDNDNDKYRLMANNNNNNTSNGHINNNNNNNNNVGNVNNYCNNTNNKNSNNCKEISISVTPSMAEKTEETNMSTSLSSTTSTSSSSLMKIDSSLLTFRANLSTFLSSFSFLCIGVIFNLAVLAIIHERVPYDAATLPDIAFDLLPRYDLALNVSEYIIMFMSTSVLLMIACHRYRWIIISRLFIILGLLYIFRAICISVTQVPVSNKDYYCSPRLNLQETSTWELIKTVIWRIIYLSLGMGLSVNGHHTYCGDFIFSGHTVILVTSDLFLVYYWLSDRRPIYFKFIKYGYHLMVIIGIIAILIARGHYMVDIVLAIVISKLIFYIYHVLCHYAIIHHNHHRYHQQQQSMKQHFEQNPFNHHHQSTDDTSIVIKADSSSTNNHRPITSDESFIYQQQQQQHCQIQRNPLNTWWYTIFEYFEKNTIHHHIQIVNSFEWPWKLFLNSKRQPLMMIV